MAGTLLFIGKGVYSSNDIKEMIEAKDRLKTGPTAPAQFLTLQHVEYLKEFQRVLLS